MKILLLCNKPPYPASEGGPMAMNSIITGLLEAGHQVKVLAVNSEKYNVNESDIPEEYKQKTRIELIDVDLDVKPVNAFLNLFTRKSYHVERFISEEFKARLVALLEKEQFDVVQLEVLFMAPYVTASALKGAIFAANIYEKLGFNVLPDGSVLVKEFVDI